jgi:hypothetical protein
MQQLWCIITLFKETSLMANWEIETEEENKSNNWN